MPDEEVKFLSTYLSSGGEGKVMADRIDCRVDRLPGLECLDLMRCAVSLCLIGGEAERVSPRQVTGRTDPGWT